MTEYKTLTLSQCAAFDKSQGLAQKLTGWGKVCLDREKRGISRSARVRKNIMNAPYKEKR